jgi:hypothetical protein
MLRVLIGVTVELIYLHGTLPGAAGPGPLPPLDVVISVKENAEVGCDAFPTSAVIPLPRGRYLTPEMLGIEGLPSQTEVLEQWPGDNSLRHVMVHFQPSVSPNGVATYHFVDSGHSNPPAPLLVHDASTTVTITTGPLRFTVSKTHFNILDQVWLDQDTDGVFEETERILDSRLDNGDVFVPRTGAGPVQHGSGRSDVLLEIEELGPLRAVIRAEAPARFISTTNHSHGFAVRIYAYAGKPFVKVDFQLQNSDKEVVRSWPLYFESLNLDFRLNLAASPTLRFGLGNGGVHQMANTSGAYLAQERHNRFRIRDLQTHAVLIDSGTLTDGTGPEGYVHVSDAQRGAMAVIRNFWQMWPNGLAISPANKLSLELFPSWSAQWYSNQLSPSGLYWVEDMQHVCKETLLYFHGPNPNLTELANLAQTFQFPPVAIVPTDWHRETSATLDLGGVIPPATTIPVFPDQRQPDYLTSGFDPSDWFNSAGPYYGAGWVNYFDPEPGYRSVACPPGGWPYSGAGLIASGNPGDFFLAEGWALGELNLRPEWMSGYVHDTDWNLLRLTENPYCGGRWRIHEGGGASTLAAPPLDGTGEEQPVYYARDDQHGWFYHVAEAYWLTGNPWIRDWYRFIAEFRRVRLERRDPYPDTSSRATAHALSHALQAARVTGDTGLLHRLGEHIREYLRPDQDPLYGDQLLSIEELGGGFQTGYLMRFAVDFLEEVRAAGDCQSWAEAFNYLSGLIEWNYHHGNFPYYYDARSGDPSSSSGTGLNLVDPQAWYYWHTGKQKYLDHLNLYVSGGIHGGEPPYGQFSEWRGQFESRYYLFVKNTPRSDSAPPPAIGDLAAFQQDSGTLIRWTAPADTMRYHIVWSTKPIVEEHSTDSGVINWWAANPVGTGLVAVPGAVQSLVLNTGDARPVYVAVFSFDSSDNMSAMSNLATAVLPSGGTLLVR